MNFGVACLRISFIRLSSTKSRIITSVRDDAESAQPQRAAEQNSTLPFK